MALTFGSRPAVPRDFFQPGLSGAVAGGASFTGTGATTGSGTAAGTGKPAFAGTGATTGSGTAAGTGVLAFAGTGATSGSGVAAGSGVSTPAGTGATTGSGTAAGSGVVAVVGTGTTTGSGAGSATGVATTRTGITSGSGTAAGSGVLAVVGSAATAGQGSAFATGRIASTQVRYFIPPVTFTGPTTLPGKHPGNALFRHYGGRAEGVNVYLMPDGTVTQTDPYSDLDALRVFHGGHIHEVNDAEALALAAAGYTITLGSSS